jgi:hypothetical protein
MIGLDVDGLGGHSLKQQFLRRTQAGLHHMHAFARHRLVQRYACRSRRSDGERGRVLMMTPHTSALFEELVADHRAAGIATANRDGSRRGANRSRYRVSR